MRLALISVAFLLGFLPGCRSAPSTPGGAGDVWAQVNGKPILRSEVEREFRRQTAGLTATLGEDEALAHKLRLLGELIHREILLQKAAQRSALATGSEVEAALRELHSPYTDSEFQRQLETQGLTLAELREELRRELSIRNLFERELGGRVEVTEAEVGAYYEAHREQFRNAEALYHVAHILVTPRPDAQVRNLRSDDAPSEAQARQKLDFLLARLRAGEDFAELARSYSEDSNTALAGGDLGFFPESALEQSDPALRSVVRSLTPGQVSGVVRSRDGYHLVKLLDRQPPGQRDLSEPQVRQAVSEHLRRQKRMLLEAAYLEVARNQARVVNHLARQILESGRALP